MWQNVFSYSALSILVTHLIRKSYLSHQILSSKNSTYIPWVEYLIRKYLHIVFLAGEKYMVEIEWHFYGPLLKPIVGVLGANTRSWLRDCTVYNRSEHLLTSAIETEGPLKTQRPTFCCCLDISWEKTFWTLFCLETRGPLQTQRPIFVVVVLFPEGKHA